MCGGAPSDGTDPAPVRGGVAFLAPGKLPSILFYYKH